MSSKRVIPIFWTIFHVQKSYWKSSIPTLIYSSWNHVFYLENMKKCFEIKIFWRKMLYELTFYTA